jgi:hypothetical protein
MRLEISDMPPAFCPGARPAGKTDVAQRVPHGSAAAAIACRVDVSFGDTVNVGSAAEEASEMSFLVAPNSDFNGAFHV